MASIIRQLNDEDLDAVHHMIRRDAKNDLEIAAHIEKRLGKKIASTDHAKEATVHRYRKSKVYQSWLKRWRNRDAELERQVRLQRERYQMMSELVRGSDESGFEGVSKSIQARLLTLAAEASDEELRDAASAKGWVATTLRLAREMLDNKWRRQVEELKDELKQMAAKPKGKTVNMRAVVNKVDEIMGLK